VWESMMDAKTATAVVPQTMRTSPKSKPHRRRRLKNLPGSYYYLPFMESLSSR
jgi:hypothetical protein